MGANQTGGHKPVGTDFKKNKADREKYGDVDIPDIPLNKLKEVCAEVDMTVKQSKYLVEYKREVRDALKRKKAKGHEPKLFRLYDKCLHPADDAAGKDEDRKGLIKLLTENITPVVKDDIIDGFKVDGKEGNLEKEADKTIHRLIHERVHDLIHETAESIFRKYLKGLNYEESDGEDEQDEAEKEEARAERAKQAAKQREYEAELWYAEMHGEEPPPKPTADEDEEEEEEESDEE
eukprot:TRINITY_DN3149_c0_g1_i2.p1 TRINITY_DN3149_c0_g1~~TRINITY_DN3149_c0_g1_i2.p1  ORF type:complete len:255 (+),score=135.29 TRINITY_DN3149_c0_g1_i2:61-765(+)